MTAAEQLQQEIEKHGGSRFKWYNEIYLLSDHWKKLKARKYKQVGRKCEKCDTTKKLQVHHLEYRSVFDVQLGDLQVLCRPCHRKEHGLAKEKPKKARRESKPKPPKTKLGKLIDHRKRFIRMRAFKLLPARIQKEMELHYDSSHQGSFKKKVTWAIERTIERLCITPKMEVWLAIKACSLAKAGKRARARLDQIEDCDTAETELNASFNNTPF